MGDAFDEFMRELERRRRQAMGEDPDTEPDADEKAEPRGPTPLDDQPRGGRGPSDGGGSGRRGGGPGGPAGPGGSGSGGAGGGTGGASGSPIRGPRRRQPGVRGFMRRYAIAIIGISVLVVLFLAGTLLDLWTDAIWYKSVGFDSVFWTRIGSQLGLFAGALLVSLAALLLNLWLARNCWLLCRPRHSN